MMEYSGKWALGLLMVVPLFLLSGYQSKQVSSYISIANLRSIEIYEVNKNVWFNTDISCSEAKSFCVSGENFIEGSKADTNMSECVLLKIDSIIKSNRKLQRILKGNPNSFEAKSQNVDARTVVLLNTRNCQYQLCFDKSERLVRSSDIVYRTRKIPDLISLIKVYSKNCN